MGFYLFLLLGLGFALLFVPAGSVSYVILLFATVVAIAPLAVDGLTQFLSWRESDNYTRFLTGSLAGALIGMDIALLLLDAIY